MLQLPRIALVGKAGAGKSTAKDILVTDYGYSHASFAAALRETVVDLFGPEYKNDRVVLQKVGTTMREIDPDVWVRKALRKMDAQVRNLGIRRHVFDDCRFPNEYYALKERGFVVVLIRADYNERVQRLIANGKFGGHESMHHISETALDDILQDPGGYDYTYDNTTGSIKDMADFLRDVLSREQRPAEPEYPEGAVC